MTPSDISVRSRLHGRRLVERLARALDREPRLVRRRRKGEKIQSQEKGAELLFYWSTFVIRLCFGSFIVAILVGAFNKVVASEARRV